MTVSKRVALGLLLVLALTGGAAAATTTNADLSGLSNREFEDYARDRFEWLTGEARSGHRIAARAKQDCKLDAPADTDGARACEIYKAATDRSDRILEESRELLTGLQQRLGSVPAWARGADGQLIAATGRTRAAAPTIAPAAASAPR